MSVLRRFTGGQRFGMAGSKLDVFFNYLIAIKANIIIYNHKNPISFKKFQKCPYPGLFEKFRVIEQER